MDSSEFEDLRVDDVVTLPSGGGGGTGVLGRMRFKKHTRTHTSTHTHTHPPTHTQTLWPRKKWLR